MPGKGESPRRCSLPLHSLRRRKSLWPLAFSLSLKQEVRLLLTIGRLHWCGGVPGNGTTARARLFGSRIGLPFKNSPLGNESGPALSSYRTGCRPSARASDVGCSGSSPLGEKGSITLLILILKHFHQLTNSFPQHSCPHLHHKTTIKEISLTIVYNSNKQI